MQKGVKLWGQSFWIDKLHALNQLVSARTILDSNLGLNYFPSLSEHKKLQNKKLWT